MKRIVPQGSAGVLTARDKALAFRDMEILVRAGGMQGYQPLMRSLGHDPLPLLARCGLSAEMLANEDNLVPIQAAYDLLALSVAHTGLEDFGLRAASIQDVTVLGPLALALQNSPTVGEALSVLTRYLYVQSPATCMLLVRPSTQVPGAVDLRYEPTDGGRLRVCPQVFDHGVGLAHNVVRMLAGERYELLAVSLPHVPRGSMRAYEQFFGVNVRTGQAFCALHFAERMLSASVKTATAAFLKVATDYIARHFPAPETRVAPRVHLALSRALGSRFVGKATIASMLALHPRTLQRRLADEGTSFEAIRDAVRRQAAMRYLTDTQYPLSQVAGLVGFTEQSTFTRFCRQKLGGTPAALRQGSEGGRWSGAK